MMSNESAVVFQNVFKAFGSREILRGVDIEVRKGETMVLLGGSGTGKSVSLRHMVGLLDPDRGKVFVNGQEMSFCSDKIKQKLRSDMGLLFQSGALINWLTVYENVALPLRELQLCDETELQRRVIEKLRWLGLMPAKDLLPDFISGGMKKRAGLARALVTNPSILLYDEPTSGLDPVMSQVFNELVVRTKKELGVTQIIVTHDMHSAYFISDRITFLYQGKVLMVGTPDEIRNSPNPIVQQFINGSTTGPMQIDAGDPTAKKSVL